MKPKRCVILLVLFLAGGGGCGSTTDVPDGGSVSDGGRVDDGLSPDGGDNDAGALDAGALDAAAPDAGALDAAVSDAGGADAGTPDSGPPEELKAFPSAYGGGAYATGGRGGAVHHVTNVAGDWREGSFQWALAQWNHGADGPATIVFDVAGVIDLEGDVVIAGKDLTIAGQTAPAGGITITSTVTNNKFRMWGVENIVVRYLRFRFQRDNNNIGIDVFGNPGGGYDPVARDLMFDHLSISYAGWTAFGCRGRDNYNVTVQNTLFAESKTGAIFGDSDSPYSHDNSFLNNFFYNVSHRFPNPSADGRVDVINNVTQNHYWRLSRPQIRTFLNHINNYHAAGAHTALDFQGMNQITSGQGGSIYTSGNIIDNGLFEDPDADNRLIWAESNSGNGTAHPPNSEFTSTPFPLIGAAVPIRTAEEAYNAVIANPSVGNSRSLNADGTFASNYDANDSAYLAVTVEGEGSYEAYTTGNAGTDRSFFYEQRYFDFLDTITHAPVSTRPPSYDTDGDGMADEWETATFGDLSKTGRADTDGDGYTDLEEFLNSVDR